jgi:hypothetical protein
MWFKPSRMLVRRHAPTHEQSRIKPVIEVAVCVAALLGCVTGVMALYETRRSADIQLAARPLDAEIAGFGAISSALDPFVQACVINTHFAYLGQITPEQAQRQCHDTFVTGVWAAVAGHLWVMPETVVMSTKDVLAFVDAEPARRSFSSFEYPVVGSTIIFGSIA